MAESPSHKKVSRTEWIIVAVLCAAVVLSFMAGSGQAFEDGLLHVYFLDVGQGDAQLIQSPTGHQVLIDGGPDDAVLQRLGEVMPLNDRTIDLLILSHAHADHVTGLIEVLQRYEVANIIESGISYDTAAYAEWNKLKTEARVIQARAGQVVDLGSDVKLTILFPDSNSGNNKVKNPHDYTVVTRLDYGSESVLFTGDMETEVEDVLIANPASLSAQFLKVGHHGSKTSTSERFLNVVRPTTAFIEVGAKNRYGHPHPTVTDRLERFGIKYYRTDIDGSSDLQLDGTNYLIRNF